MHNKLHLDVLKELNSFHWLICKYINRFTTLRELSLSLVFSSPTSVKFPSLSSSLFVKS